MTGGYTKLFSSIVTGSIWNESHATRIVWITLLALANKHGEVSAAVPGLAVVSRVTDEECRKAVSVLESPDQDSRTKELDGRRIIPIEGGWQIVNYTKFRNLISADDRRDYQARWAANKRASTNIDSIDTSIEQKAKSKEAESSNKKRKPVSPAEVIAYGKEKGISTADCEAFFDSQESGGWTRAGKPLHDWKAALRTWKSNGWLASQKQQGKQRAKEAAPSGEAYKPYFSETPKDLTDEQIQKNKKAAAIMISELTKKVAV